MLKETGIASYYISPPQVIQIKKNLFASESRTDITKIINYIECRMPFLYYIEHTYQYLLNKLPPKAFVVENDLIPELRIPVLMAHKYNIPTICVQHGAINATTPIFGHICVDSYFVYGDQAKTHLENMGNAKVDIIVTGGIVPLTSEHLYETKEV